MAQKKRIPNNGEGGLEQRSAGWLGGNCPLKQIEEPKILNKIVE